MGEALPEDTWSKEFRTANARPLLSSLQHRLQASTTHIHALAELYHERALIEQDYAAKLGKLTKSAEAGQLLGKNGTPWDRNGGEGKLWDAVLSDIQEVCSLHRDYADRRPPRLILPLLPRSSLTSKVPFATSPTRSCPGDVSMTRRARLTAP